MSQLIVKTKATEQPRSFTPIDLASPLANGISWAFNKDRQVVGNYAQSLLGGNFDYESFLTTSTNDGLNFGRNNPLTNATRATWVFSLDVTTPGVIASNWGNGANYSWLVTNPGAGYNFGFVLSSNALSSTGYWGLQTNIALGKSTIAIVWNGGKVASIYQNGIKLTTAIWFNNSFSGTIVDNTATNFLLGRQNIGGTGNAGVIKYLFGAIYRRAMSDIEAISITKNPWQIFTPQNRFVYLNTTGTSNTLTGAAGSYSLTGIAATLSYAPGSGAYSLTGDAGSYALTGNTASFKVGRNLQGANGNYTLTGNAATLTYTPGSATQNYTLSGAAGSYVLTGLNATFDYSGDVITVITGGGIPRKKPKYINNREDIDRIVAAEVERVLNPVIEQEKPIEKSVIQQKVEQALVVNPQLKKSLELAIAEANKQINEYMEELDDEEAIFYLFG